MKSASWSSRDRTCTTITKTRLDNIFENSILINVDIVSFFIFQAHYALLYCDLCGEEFKGKEKLRVHKINKHLENHQKPYVCAICGKGFAYKTKLQSHQMNVHIRSRPYKCRLEGCEADFNELANRNTHERRVHNFNYRKIVGSSADGATTIIVQEDS